MIKESIQALGERKGSSLYAIKACMEQNYDVNIDKIKHLIKKYLKESVVGGEIIQASGVGASGRFKMAPRSAKTAPKVAKAAKPKKKPSAATSIAKAEPKPAPKAKKIDVTKKLALARKENEQKDLRASIFGDESSGEDEKISKQRGNIKKKAAPKRDKDAVADEEAEEQENVAKIDVKMPKKTAKKRANTVDKHDQAEVPEKVAKISKVVKEEAVHESGLDEASVGESSEMSGNDEKVTKMRGKAAKKDASKRDEDVIDEKAEENQENIAQVGNINRSDEKVLKATGKRVKEPSVEPTSKKSKNA